MTKYNEAVLNKYGNIILPRGRLVYPALFKPQLMKGETDESKAKYQCSVLLPANAVLKALIEDIDAKIAENVTEAQRKTAKIKKPILKTEDQPRFAEYAEAFPYLLRMSSKTKPDVVSATGQIVQDEAEVYSGRWGRVSVRAFFYDHPTGGKGMSLGLQNVQILEHDEPLAGGRARAEDEFEPVEVSADAIFMD